MRNLFFKEIDSPSPLRFAMNPIVLAAFHLKITFRLPCATLLLLALPITLASCQPEAETSAPIPRPVRTITVERSEAGIPVMLTGRIEAEDEVTLAFDDRRGCRRCPVLFPARP